MAWPIMPQGAAPPVPVAPRVGRVLEPSAVTRSLWNTTSCSQRTTPSMSAGRMPASSMAARLASTAMVSALRPLAREKSLAPTPVMAQRPRWS